MATLKIGELVVDLEKVSEDEQELLLQFENDSIMTDAVIAALAGYSKLYGTSRSGNDGEESKASKMRRMKAAGMSTGDIAKALGVRFQFVYNVLNRPAKAS